MKNIKQLKWLLPILLQLCFTHSNAQLNVGEYFFDTDPGVGNGIAINNQQIFGGLTYDSTTSTTMILIPNSMNPGVHTLYVRYSSYDTANGRMWSNYEARKFTVNPPSGNGFALAEYFFDTDPGVGNATSIPLTGNADSSDYLGNINTTGLITGAHTLHVRTKTATGIWSNFETRKIIVNVANGSSIVEAEYFYDQDPGIGNATSITLSGNTDSSSFAGNVSTIGLSLGSHQLCIRAKNANGQWGIYETKKIKILSNGNALEAMEYFFDTDPGVGNATALTIIQTGDSAAYTGNISTTGLSLGKHQLFVRGKSVDGQWSQYENRKLMISTVPTIAEYFIDVDPGVGNGNLISLNQLGGDSAETNTTILTDSSLEFGPHKLYVRVKDNEGKWGLYEKDSFHVTPATISLKAFLQGYYVGSSTMAPTLFNEGVGSNSTITDTIVVELHQSIAPYNLAYSYKGVLSNTGLINCKFSATTIGSSYYIVIKHRNSLETWSNNPILISENNSYDFTTAANQAFGSNQAEVETGVYGLYSGDINQDGYVDGADYPAFDHDASIGLYGVYVSTDLNGDGYVDGADYPVFDANSSLGVYVLKP